MKKLSSHQIMIVAACMALGSVIMALFLQLLIPEMKPCPLCILQRYAYLLFALFALLGARFEWKILNIAAFASVIAGLAVSIYHNWVIAHPNTSCGIDPLETLLNKLYPAQWLPFIFAADGLCSAALPPIFGLSIVSWSLFMFIVLTSVCTWFLFRRNAR